MIKIFVYQSVSKSCKNVLFISSKLGKRKLRDQKNLNNPQSCFTLDLVKINNKGCESHSVVSDSL